MRLEGGLSGSPPIFVWLFYCSLMLLLFLYL